MNTKRAKAAEAPDPLHHARRLQELIAEFCVEAMDFTARPKAEDTAHQWLARANLDPDDPHSADTVAQALMLALELAMFAPSLSGSTAVDRLVRQRNPSNGEERAALEALQQASFRLLRIRSFDRKGVLLVEDLATGKTLSILDRDIPVAAMGIALVARLCPLPGGIFGIVGPLTPLDDAALDVAMGFVRPGKGLANPQRCAAAVYRHVVRHGVPHILGLNSFRETEDDQFLFEFEDTELDSLAHAWAKLSSDAEPPSGSVNAARSLSSADCLIDALVSSIAARRNGKSRLADAYSRLASIQMETMQRRAAVGFGADAAPLDRVSAVIERGIAGKRLFSEVRALFDHLRRLLLVTAGAGAKTGDEDLARVVQRIQALRAKTVDQGCTEQEALASANKVAELLDRYGLSLSEIEFRRQACEGFGVDTGRRRRCVFDACVPSIAAFCDCKVWGETTPAGSLRHVFFGFPADVEAAHFLYDLIGVTFDTETARFKTGTIYASMETGERRSAVNSFQTGLSHGIGGKLKAMKAERDISNRASSGRDLVPLKTSVIDDELAKLGLSFHAISRGRRKRVLADAYKAGQIAGYQFEVRAGIDVSSAN
ncbi:MAG TPA: DUF2786 domain-containing protein [Methylocella sp.]|nr:DUF2786 domain-containing protein [Methylocella sp.]